MRNRTVKWLNSNDCLQMGINGVNVDFVHADCKQYKIILVYNKGLHHMIELA